jgi:PmbA protein
VDEDKLENLDALCNGLLTRAADAGADQAEALATYQHNVETRMENDDIHTVQSTDETMLGLRVFVGGSLGFATTNRFDVESLKACVGEAVAQAGVLPPDPNNGLPPDEPVTPVEGLWHEATASSTVSDTTELAAAMLARVREADTRVRVDSGGVSATTWAGTIASSTGLRASERGTAAEGHLFGMAVDGEEVASFDYDGDAAHSLAGMRGLIDDAVDRFVAKCLSGLGAQAGRSFKGNVVLSPEVVGEFLLPNLVSALCADAVRKGRSPLAEKLGETIAVESFTLIDDGTRPGGMASSAFDREGVPIRRHTLVENGVLRTFLYNHYEARAAGNGAKSTGHASGGASSLPAISPVQLELAAGDIAASDLLDGGGGPLVHVGRFSGSTNPVTGDFSGVVKNGFLIEKGLQRPIRETLIAGNLFQLLHAITGISRERRLLGGSQRLPSIRAEGVSVTAG